MFDYKIIKIPKKLKIEENKIFSIFSYISKIINKKQNGILNIIFVSNTEIKKLNNDFRKINKPTDVLSFHYFDDFSKIKNNEIAGEIVISQEKLFSQALEFGLENQEEFYKLLIHSILHILGYDHEIEKDFFEMNNLENDIASKIFGKIFF